jgi:hypothetical protein
LANTGHVENSYGDGQKGKIGMKTSSGDPIKSLVKEARRRAKDNFEGLVAPAEIIAQFTHFHSAGPLSMMDVDFINDARDGNFSNRFYDEVQATLLRIKSEVSSSYEKNDRRQCSTKWPA